MNEYIKRSPVTGKKYSYFSDDVIRLVNLAQCDFYMQEFGIMPLDIMLSDDRKRPGKKIVLFVFSKSETKQAYDAWCEREHSDEKQV